jgi:hypothetical protein
METVIEAASCNIVFLYRGEACSTIVEELLDPDFSKPNIGLGESGGEIYVLVGEHILKLAMKSNVHLVIQRPHTILCIPYYIG